LATLFFIAIAPIVAFVAVRYWRNALFFAFVLLVFEGALRKWVFPGAQAQIYFVKDVIFVGAYVGFLLASRRDRFALRDVNSIKIGLVLTFVFGCLEVFNPLSPSILVGVMGLKAYFMYAPLAFILPYAIKSRQHLLFLIWCYLLIAIPVALLGFVQSAAGPDSFINTYAGQDESGTNDVSGFGSTVALVRTTGTFSYISGYTTYLSFIAFLSLGFNIAQGWRIKGNIVPLAALTLVVGAMFTTGSRTPVYTLVVVGPIVVWWAVTTRVMALRTAIRLCFILPILAVVALNISSQAYDAFTERATGSSDSTIDRLLSPVVQTLEALSNTPALGIGIGTTHPSATVIVGATSPWWLGGLQTETEMARVTVELGPIGLLLVYGLRILVVIFALVCSFSYRDSAYRALGFVLAFQLGFGLINSIVLNSTEGIYYWGSLGLLVAMRRLEQAKHVGTRAFPQPSEIAVSGGRLPVFENPPELKRQSRNCG
jgi:hypothetical protein